MQFQSILSLGLCAVTAHANCIMGIDVLDQTVSVTGGTHQQYCKATIWDGTGVDQTPKQYVDIGCNAGSTATVKYGGWNYHFKLNKSVGPSGKLGDGDAEVAREYVGASVPFNEHYSHTSFGAVNVAITNIAYANVDCPFVKPPFGR